VFWNDRSGVLLVRATMQDLGTIRRHSNPQRHPNQINIKQV
jgi:hypothetical protein